MSKRIMGFKLGWMVGLVLLVACSDSEGGAAADAGLNEAGPPVDAGLADILGTDAEAADGAMPDAEPHPGLLNPALANETAPETFAVRFTLTTGEVVVDFTRAWAPQGVDRIYNLVRIGYFDDTAFFRVLPGFIAQVGIHGNPATNAVWSRAAIADDPVVESNTRGRVTFATAGPNTRTTQIFINFGNNAGLDGQGFAPLGQVRDLAPLEALYAGYGEGAPQGAGPSQARIQAEGNVYLRAEFPELDYIVRARVE